MSIVVMDKKEELIMRLVHYFITEQNYNPIVVNGVKDEIWLENSEGPYYIVRINSNNIFNKEQLNFDHYKTESIVKQIKKKTFSFNVNTLNILLDLNEDIKLEEVKNIVDAPIFDNNSSITNESILEAFPNINEKLLKDAKGIDLMINVTKDINEKTERENRQYEKTFSTKKIYITQAIILLCSIAFLITTVFGGLISLLDVPSNVLVFLGANNIAFLKNYEVWRLITYMFLHGSLLHLLVNMYSLYIIGTQIENYYGKAKYITIYIISGICGGLLSAIGIGSTSISVGASGALFGLLGALAYFGYNYRLYLGNVLKTQIVPVIAVNLLIGFMVQGIDNFCHIGGLVSGIFLAMALGVEGKSKKSDRINGFICLSVFIIFCIYMIYFR